MFNTGLEIYLYRIPAMLIGLTVHEYAHGLMAHLLGDNTAKNLGRLTFNPLKHLDPLGTILLIIAGFGWAKPVPVNPFNIKGNRRLGMVLVSLAGPGSNIITALVAVLVKQALELSNSGSIIIHQALYHLILLNVVLAAFNLIPLPPLDGAGIVEGMLPGKQKYYYQRLERYAPVILLLLIMTGFIQAIFIPIARVIMTIIDFISSLLLGLFF